MLSVVDFVPVDFKRRCSSAEEAPPFIDLYDIARVFEIEAGRESCEARADNCYALRSHDFTKTPSFSERVSDARARSGRRGSRSIFPRIT